MDDPTARPDHHNATMPIYDDDALDMIEDAFLGYQIDAMTYRLSRLWVEQFQTLSDVQARFCWL